MAKCLSMTVLSIFLLSYTFEARAVDPEDLEPNYLTFWEGVHEEEEDFFTNSEISSCEGWGTCIPWEFSNTNIDEVDEIEGEWIVDGTLPGDYETYYWDLDDPSWKTTDDKSKGTGWVYFSEDAPDDWDYTIAEDCDPPIPVNRVTWDYSAQYIGGFWWYFIDAVEVFSWRSCTPR